MSGSQPVETLRKIADGLADMDGDNPRPQFLRDLADSIEYLGEPAFLGFVAKRMSQVLEHGYGVKHDDLHDRGELALAAACYAVASNAEYCPDQPLVQNTLWPFDPEYWKPKGKRHNLEVAGALIAAELARLQRIDERTP